MPAIERYLDDYTRSLTVPGNLREAIRYALLGGGKRLRPVLAWHCSAALGGAGEASLPAGAAVELVHAFSLVHDDLPAMDDDDLRRGKPTLHIHSGEAMAILAGDAMLALAFALVRERGGAAAAALSHELSDSTVRMIAGQVYDTLGGLHDGLTDRQQLELIHSNKTGALIRAACRMGAICALGGDSAEPALAAVTDYAAHVGLMFQITDDLLDAEGTPEQTGKRTRKDRDAGKLTYPAVLGVEGSKREVQQLLGSALATLETLGKHAEPLRELARGIAARRS